MTTPFTAGRKLRASEMNALLAPTAWTAIPGATAFGAGTQSPQYRKFGDEVQLRGLMAAATNNTTLGTLPVGFRPPATCIFATTSDTATANRIDVLSTGVITRVYGSGPESLDGLRFSTI